MSAAYCSSFDSMISTMASACSDGVSGTVCFVPRCAVMGRRMLDNFSRYISFTMKASLRDEPALLKTRPLLQDVVLSLAAAAEVGRRDEELHNVDRGGQQQQEDHEDRDAPYPLDLVLQDPRAPVVPQRPLRPRARPADGPPRGGRTGLLRDVVLSLWGYRPCEVSYCPGRSAVGGRVQVHVDLDLGAATIRSVGHVRPFLCAHGKYIDGIASCDAAAQGRGEKRRKLG